MDDKRRQTNLESLEFLDQINASLNGSKFDQPNIMGTLIVPSLPKTANH